MWLLYATTFSPSLSILSRYAWHNNAVRGRKFVVNFGETEKVQREKYISSQLLCQLHYKEQVFTVNVYICLYKAEWQHTNCQSIKENIDLAHAL